jgi:hypothetical protein
MNELHIIKDSTSWKFWVILSFPIATIGTLLFIWLLLSEPISVKGALTICVVYIVHTSFSLAKLLRDIEEERKKKREN